MKLFEVVRFEVSRRLRRPSTWIYAALLLALSVWAVSLDAADVERPGEMLVNAPYHVAGQTVGVALLGLLVTAALFGEAATRDVRTRMEPLLYTAPLGRGAYLGGRFLGAFATNALLFAVAALGLMLAPGLLGLEPELLGPFRPVAYAQAYLYLLLPIAFVAGVVVFTVSLLSRRALAGYVAGAALFVWAFFTQEYVSGVLGRETLATLVEPFGMSALDQMSAGWTALERNTLGVVRDATLLSNRLLWLALAVALFAFACRRFRFAHHAPGGRRSRKPGGVGTGDRADAVGAAGGGAAGLAVHADGRTRVPGVRRAFDSSTRLQQTLSVARRSFRDLAASRGALVLMAIAAVVAVVLVPELADDHLGTPGIPTTARVASALGHPPTLGLIVAALTAFCAGELVWRERGKGMHPLTDAAPVPGWVPLAGKLLALALLLAALQLLLMGTGVLTQALRGHFDFEIGLYLKILFGLRLVDYLLFAVLALAVHVLVDQKYAGHLIVLLSWAATTFTGEITVLTDRLPFSPDLLLYGGSGPGWVYSDLAGFGPFLGPWTWFELYWGGWALLLALAAKLFWVRGEERGLVRRLRLARRRFGKGAGLAVATSIGLVLGSGGFVFYNTEILNEYRSEPEQTALAAEYERRYGAYRDAPQPTVTSTKLRVEVRPERREAEVRGTYGMVNRAGTVIDSIHLHPHPAVRTVVEGFDRPARTALVDRELGHRIYTLDDALEPGDSLRMRFEVRFDPRGFPAGGVNTSVVGNGTYISHDGGRTLDDRSWLPVLGYHPGREVVDPRRRREHGLPLRGDLPSLYDVPAAGRESIHFEAVVGTAADQIAVAPGRLRRTWTEGGRRYFHYATDAPIKHSFGIFSADYAVREDRWKDVRIQIFHHPEHDANLDRMVRGVKAALDHYTENFGPYPLPHVRIVEYPRYSSFYFARAYAGVIAYVESMGFLSDVDGERDLDTPFLTIAHEMAHQWWGHQVVPAAVEGAPLLTEILAQYGTLAVFEEAYGRDAVRRLLDIYRIEYLNSRGTREVPLLRVTDQSHLIYQKGALAMHALRDYLGEERIDRALRRLLEEHGSGGPPHPTSLDLYRELESVAPDSLRWLLEDLLAENMLWYLRARRATAEPTGDGEWRVTLDLTARKVEADSAGGEAEVEMDDLVEVGVFAAAEGSDGPGEPLYLRKHRLRSGEQSITVTVPEQPARAGVDPYVVLIDGDWRDERDNVVDVETKETP